MANLSLTAGSSKAAADISHLPAAVYFYRYIVNGATVNTGKIVLIK